MTYPSKIERLRRAQANGATIYIRGTNNAVRWLPRADQSGGTDPYPWVDAWGDRHDGVKLEARS